MIYFNKRNGSSGFTRWLILRLISATAIYGRWNSSLCWKGRWYPTGTKLYNHWVKRFFDMRREKERDTIFLCRLLLHRQLSMQPTCGARSAQNRLASPSSESQPSSSQAHCFSEIPQILSPRFQCMTSLTFPGLNSYLGFLFWYLWMTYPLRARVNTCVNVVPY